MSARTYRSDARPGRHPAAGRLLFLTESAALASIGGVIGLPAASARCRLAAAGASLPVATPFAFVIAALLVAAVAGWPPACPPAARRLDPIDSRPSKAPRAAAPRIRRSRRRPPPPLFNGLGRLVSGPTTRFLPRDFLQGPLVGARQRSGAPAPSGGQAARNAGVVHAATGQRAVAATHSRTTSRRPSACSRPAPEDDGEFLAAVARTHHRHAGRRAPSRSSAAPGRRRGPWLSLSFLKPSRSMSATASEVRRRRQRSSSSASR